MQNDWAYLEKYALENQKLLKLHNKGNRIVLIGDSITEFWERYDSIFFSQNNYINRGISSQTTSQILERVQNDVIDLQPKRVIILVGINDIAENNGPISLEETFQNIVLMVNKANENNVEAILCSVLPTNSFYWNPKVQPIDKIMQLNQMIKAYSLINQIKYVDYYTEMIDENLGLDTKYSDDGVHPNLDGYLKMKTLLETHIK